MCGILYNHLLRLEYAAGNDAETIVCKRCHETIEKWIEHCPFCNEDNRYLTQLVETVTFFESEFAKSLCEMTDIDYKACIETAKRHFLGMPEDRQEQVLEMAKEWWDNEVA